MSRPGASKAQRREDQVVVAVDFGSTFTKVCLIALDPGRLLASGAHPTTLGDLRDGLRGALENADAGDAAVDAAVLACSSAGGGLRVAVAGLEEDLTVRAGHYAAMSAGARVVQTLSEKVDLAQLAAAQPDLVVLTGGLDDGDEDCLLSNAEALAASDIGVPVVIAGNAAVAGRAAGSLARSGVAVTVSPNVMPSAGVLNVAPVRARIRELFIRHVIGGRQVNGSSELRQMVRMATPDAVLLGTELLARAWERDVVVLDVGGATTDVHSYVRAPMARQGTRVRLTPEESASRTVEGDLGVWSGAPGLVDAAAREGVLAPDRAAEISASLPRGSGTAPSDELDDLELAGLASRLAVRRHAGRLRTHVSPDGVVVEAEGKDLRSVSAVIGSGGVFRRAERQSADQALRAAVESDGDLRRLVPDAAVPMVDEEYVLSAAGLVSTVETTAAVELLRTTMPVPV